LTTRKAPTHRTQRGRQRRPCPTGWCSGWSHGEEGQPEKTLQGIQPNVRRLDVLFSSAGRRRLSPSVLVICVYYGRAEYYALFVISSRRGKSEP
jgi:hypothetical protein